MSVAEADLTMSPYSVAKDTYVIPWVLPAPPVGLFPMNSLVIRGTEPIIVDTGSPADRDGWLKNVASVVDLEDVRWIFLSHDDRDHAGNLLAALEACPQATLLTTWFSVGRMSEEWSTPLDRCRFLNDGESVDLGDRTVRAILPPVFDNPTSRALFDEKTGVLWSVDTFATPMGEPMAEADGFSEEDFREGQLLGSRLVAAWHPWLDETKYCNHVQKVRGLPISTVAGCHTPAIQGERLREAFDLLMEFPTVEPWAPFTQADLEQWMSAAE